MNEGPGIVDSRGLPEESGGHTEDRTKEVPEQRKESADEQSNRRTCANSEDLHELGLNHLDHFLRLGNLEDLEESIEYLSRALSLTPEGHSNMPGRLAGLGASYGHRFRRLGQLKDIEKAIECRSRALELTPDEHPNMPDRLSELGASYGNRFQRLDELEDLDKAIKHLSRALTLTPEGHPDIRVRLANMGASYSDRYQRLGQLADLDKSIQHLFRALALTPKDHPCMPRQLANLAVSYIDRFKRLDQLEDLEKAIKQFSHALLLTPEGHPDMARRLASLGAAYGYRFQRLEQLEDLEKAIEHRSRALKATPEGHPDMANRMASLGMSYTDQYRRLDRAEDLEKAIEYHSRAFALTPKGHRDISERLADLGGCYTDRYRRLGQEEDAEKAIECCSRALALTPCGHPDMPIRLANVGASYSDRYQRLGQLEDLERSIEHRSHALTLTPDGHLDMPDRLASLGASYGIRYRRLGEVGDVEKAIQCYSRALALTPNDHPEMANHLAGLGVSHGDRYQRLGQLEDLEKSIKHKSHALALTPEGHPSIPDRLTELGVSYRDRYRRIGQLEDLENIIEYSARALALTPERHQYWPVRLANLAGSYSNRFQRFGQMEDLERSIQHFSSALASTPDSHPDLCRLHSNLATSHLDLFHLTGDLTHLKNSLDSFRSSSQLLTGAPRDRFQYALEWATCASKHTSLNPIEAYQITIDLLPQYIWLGATTSQRYQDLSTVENLAVNAATIAILSSQYMLALEWLEHARCVVWNQSLMLRSPLNELHSFHPDLAIQLQTVANRLHEAGSEAHLSMVNASASDSTTPEQLGQQRRHLAQEYHNLLAEVRTLSGFEDFLQPIKAKGLIHAARNGPVVVINCHEGHGDALLVLPGQIHINCLHLPNFTYEKAQRARSDLDASYRHMRSRERVLRRPHQQEPEDCIENMLTTLWTDIVKPIFDFLGYTNNAPRDKLPHITWCPTGALSFLPLHAAGDYTRPGARVFEYAISSYTPTLTALLDSNSSSFNHNCRVIGIGQANTPGQSPLPGTVKELACLRGYIQDNANYSQLIDSQATTTAVLDAMEQHDWVHLACHAHQNVQDPTKSGFFLHDDVLDLACINRRSFKNKGLAFLSACQTATGDEKLPDEAIHLASGMLMAGYRSVIATMWSVVDQDAPLVADKVYEQLMKYGRIGNGEAGKALHYAVAALRDEVGEKAFGRWVPYIHLGS